MEKKTKILLGVVLVLAIIYGGGVFYYNGHFLKGTSINGLECSNQTVSQVEEKIKKKMGSYKLTILEREGKKDVIEGKDIKVDFLDNNKIKQFQESQNEWVWLASYFGQKYEKEIKTVTYDEKALEKLYKKFDAFKKEKNPISAYPKYNGKGEYEIVAEDEGTKIDKKKLKEEIQNSIYSGITSFDADKKGCYVEPKYRKDSKEIKALKEEMDALVKGSITWDFSERYINLTKYKSLIKDNKVTVNGDITHKFIKIKSHTKAVIDAKEVEDWVISFAKDSNTIYKGRKFIKHNGKKINVPSGGPYGWRIDCEKETKAIEKMMEEGTTKERKPYYKQKAVTGTNGKLNDIGTSYVEVDLTNQMVYLVQKGKTTFSTSCVTGNTSLGRGTHTGVGLVQYKTRNKILGGPGYDYASKVRYWMPFNGGEGLHDADWRNSFGGTIYKTRGSHGCVNLPIYAAAKIYSVIDAGWAVVVYY